MIRRIFDLLEPSEKRGGVKVTLSIFVVALLDFVERRKDGEVPDSRPEQG